MRIRLAYLASLALCVPAVYAQTYYSLANAGIELRVVEELSEGRNSPPDAKVVQDLEGKPYTVKAQPLLDGASLEGVLVEPSDEPAAGPRKATFYVAPAAWLQLRDQTRLHIGKKVGVLRDGVLLWAVMVVAGVDREWVSDLDERQLGTLIDGLSPAPAPDLVARESTYISWLEENLQREPQNEDAARTLFQRYLQSNCEKAAELVEAGRVGKMQTAMLAQCFQQQEDFERAAHYFRSVLDDPPNGWAWSLRISLGYTYKKLGRSREALEQFRPALEMMDDRELDPNDDPQVLQFRNIVRTWIAEAEAELKKP